MKTTERTISIVTPVTEQTRSREIENCLKSSVTQGYQNFEHVIVASRLNSETEHTLRDFPQAKVIQGINENIGELLNAGFKISQGDICCWLQAYSLIVPGALAAVVEEFSSEPGEIIQGNTIQATKEGRIKAWHVPDEILTSSRLSYWWDNPCYSSSIFFRKRILGELGGFNEDLPIGLEYDFLLRAINAGHSLHHLNLPLSIILEASSQELILESLVTSETLLLARNALTNNDCEAEQDEFWHNYYKHLLDFGCSIPTTSIQNKSAYITTMIESGLIPPTQIMDYIDTAKHSPNTLGLIANKLSQQGMIEEANYLIETALTMEDK